MKYIKYLLLVITGALLGAGSIIILQDDSKNDKVSEDSIFENLIIPFSEEYIIGNDGDKSLYIRFKEDAFNIKEGEEFNYRAAIASSNGDTTLEFVNAPYIELTEGQYLVQYIVRDKEDSSKSRTYVKLLTVSKD